MPIRILLPNALRPLAAGNDRVPLEAQTIAAALEQLVQRYPQLEGRLPNPTGPGEGIFRNGSPIHTLQGLDTPLRDGDNVTLIVPEGEL